MGRSPLRDGGSGFLPLLFPTLLQVFWLHLGFSLLDCLHNSFPLRQCTTGWLNPTTPPSKQAAQKKETHPGIPGVYEFVVSNQPPYSCFPSESIPPFST